MILSATNLCPSPVTTPSQFPRIPQQPTIIAMKKISGKKSKRGIVLCSRGPKVAEEEKLTTVPKHVAVILDGNRRWARSKGLPVKSGYEVGYGKLGFLMDQCLKRGVQALTTFVFSTENWGRSKEEVDTVMAAFENSLQLVRETTMRRNIRVSGIGDMSRLPDSLQQTIAHMEKNTENNVGLQVMLAVNYSGQYDIVQACQRIGLQVKEGRIDPQDIDGALIEQELETRCTKYPNPDLLIRPGKEQRISNFFLWQLAYTELYYAGVLWPDFGEEEFSEALEFFQKRHRRYGSI